MGAFYHKPGEKAKKKYNYLEGWRKGWLLRMMDHEEGVPAVVRKIEKRCF